MDRYAAEVAAVVAHLDLQSAIHVGHSTGGSEATHYVARQGKGRVAGWCSLAANRRYEIRAALRFVQAAL